VPLVDEALISLGQLASLTWLSPKALRLCQSQGLLEPSEIDPSSYYRYYMMRHMLLAQLIVVGAASEASNLRVASVSSTRLCCVAAGLESAGVATGRERRGGLAIARFAALGSRTCRIGLDLGT